MHRKASVFERANLSVAEPGVAMVVDRVFVRRRLSTWTTQQRSTAHDVEMNAAMEEARRARRLRIELQLLDARSRLIAILLACAAMLQSSPLLAELIPVRHTEGLIHGFLVVRTLEGKAVADGQMTQDARDDRVTNHLTFRFKDGSIYEDMTIFSQRGTFRLLSDHLIQRGPSFKQTDGYLDRRFYRPS